MPYALKVHIAGYFFHKGKNRAVPKVQLRKGCCYSPSWSKWTKEYAVEIVRMAQ